MHLSYIQKKQDKRRKVLLARTTRLLKALRLTALVNAISGVDTVGIW